MPRHPRAGRTLAAILVTCLGLPAVASAQAPAKPTEDGGAVPLAVRAELLQLLRTDQFAALDLRLRAYQERAEGGDGDELEVAQAFDTFATSDPALEAHLDGFVAARPGWASRLARAEWRSRRAQLERGTRWAKDTTPAQFEGLERWVALAREDLKLALEDGPRVQAAHALAIDGLSHGGTAAERAQVLARALDADPDAYLVRRTYLVTLLPRWGGSRQAMEAFVADAEKRAERNPRLRLLRGRIDRDQGDALSREGHHDAAVLAYGRAVALGPMAAALRDRGAALVRADRPGEALSDLNLAIVLYPGFTDVYTARARAHQQLGRRDRALKDLDLAIELDPMDPQARDARAGVRIDLTDWAGAEEDLLVAVRYEPGDAGPWLRLGWVQAYHTRKVAEGQQAVARAVELSPEWDEARNLLAAVQKLAPAKPRRPPAAPPASAAP